MTIMQCFIEKEWQAGVAEGEIMRHCREEATEELDALEALTARTNCASILALGEEMHYNLLIPGYF